MDNTSDDNIGNERIPIQESFVSGASKLYIIFGGINAGVGIPPFEFFNASSIINEHKIFLRDYSQSWYHCGLPGISDNIIGTCDHLKNRIKEYGVNETILVGNSMGGFAAILFASMLSNCRAITISPQTYISPTKRFMKRDHRFGKPIRRTYLKALFKKKFYDLAQIDAHKTDWEADLLVSAHQLRDCAHAENIKHLPQIRIHRFDFKSHRLVKELRDCGILGDILMGNIPPANERGIIPLSSPSET